MLGQFADSYTQREGLGQGKYGKVFSVVHNQTKKEFAVKFYSTKKLFDDNFQKCVLYEIDRMRDISVNENLSCLKLVRLYEGQNYIYCINEVLKGGELREAMRDRPGFSEWEILRIIYQVLVGVNFLESKRLVHRDIKASNIVFRKKGDISDPVLIDFGFCLRYEDIDKKNTTHGYCSGTPGYLAPEMLSGNPYTSKADVFSVGCLMFFMMTYIPPFYGPDKESILSLNHRCKPNFGFNDLFGETPFSDESMELLAILMQRDPEDRFSSGEAMDHEAFDILFEESSSYDDNLEEQKIVSRKVIIDSNKNKLKSLRFCELVHGNIPDSERAKYKIGSGPKKGTDVIRESRYSPSKVFMENSEESHHNDLESQSKATLGEEVDMNTSLEAKKLGKLGLAVCESSLNLDGQCSANFSIVSRNQLRPVSGKEPKNRDFKQKYVHRNLGMWKMKGFKPNGHRYLTEAVRKDRRGGSSKDKSQISIDTLVKDGHDDPEAFVNPNPQAFVGLRRSGEVIPSSIGPFGKNRESRPGSAFDMLTKE